MSKHQFQNNQSFILQHNKKDLLCSDSSQASFTLVELLIVIGILAILTAVVVIVLNPANLLQEARDAQRIQDLASVDKSITILESLNPSVDLGTASTVYVSIPSDQSNCSDLGLPAISGWDYACATETNLHNTDGTGWIPVNFQDNSGVIQLSSLPVDPINTTTTGLYYTYIKGSWELTAALESIKYQQQTAANDGGDSATVYERRSRGIQTTTPTTLITRGGGEQGSSDTTAPVIALVGDASVTVYLDDTYTDDGATATDDTDGDITANIVTVNPVNTAVEDTYTVTYNVSDAAGNPATEVTRTVTVAPLPFSLTVDFTGTTHAYYNATPPAGVGVDTWEHNAVTGETNATRVYTAGTNSNLPYNRPSGNALHMGSYGIFASHKFAFPLGDTGMTFNDPFRLVFEVAPGLGVLTTDPNDAYFEWGITSDSVISGTGIAGFSSVRRYERSRPDNTHAYRTEAYIVDGTGAYQMQHGGYTATNHSSSWRRLEVEWNPTTNILSFEWSDLLDNPGQVISSGSLDFSSFAGLATMKSAPIDSIFIAHFSSETNTYSYDVSVRRFWVGSASLDWPF